MYCLVIARTKSRKSVGTANILTTEVSKIVRIILRVLELDQSAPFLRRHHRYDTLSPKTLFSTRNARAARVLATTWSEIRKTQYIARGWDAQCIRGQKSRACVTITLEAMARARAQRRSRERPRGDEANASSGEASEIYYKTRRNKFRLSRGFRREHFFN